MTDRSAARSAQGFFGVDRSSARSAHHFFCENRNPGRNLEEKEAATSYFGKVTDLKLIIKE
jgi:hypothetical protein